MWNLDTVDDAEAEFIRNIRLVSTSTFINDDSSVAGRYSPKEMLESFLRDLSFWEDSELDTSNEIAEQLFQQEKRQTKQIRTVLDATSSVTSGNRKGSSNNNNNKGPSYNSMRQRDRSYRRRGSRGSANPNPARSTATVQEPVWKTAVDPSSGRTYYYEAATRKTQWHKPPEIRAMEKQKKLERRKRDLAFFQEMEQNLIESLRRGELIPLVPLTETTPQGPPQEPAPSPANRMRTISSMDHLLLAELRDDVNVLNKQQQPQLLLPPQYRPAQSTPTTPLSHTPPHAINSKSGRPPLPSGPSNGSRRSLYKSLDSMETSPDDRSAAPEAHKHPLHRDESSDCLAGERLLDAGLPPSVELDLSDSETRSPPAGGHTRRNTGGTIYVQSTMTNPDIEATIKCVCSVYRAHIIQASERKMPLSPVSVMIGNSHSADVALFQDDYEHRHYRRQNTSPPIPSLADVVAFYEEFYRRSQMEHDTIIVSLIYVERLIKMSHGVATPMSDNWRSVLFACMVLASKVWDDLSMWNIDFSNVSANTAGLSSFTLRRINDLELGLLKSLNFDVKVPASEYAKYYFLIRTMLLRSGLLQNVEKPLGKQDAFQTLEKRTTNYQQSKFGREPQHGNNKKLKSPPRGENRGRAKSMDCNFGTWLSEEAQKTGPVLRDSVCLEQLVGC